MNKDHPGPTAAGDVGQAPTVSSTVRIAMISIHGYVCAHPPLGAVDTGGQVVYVLELSRKLASLGYEVDIWTRRFDHQPEEETLAPGVRILRVPCGPPGFIRKEDLHPHIPEWCDHALRRLRETRTRYIFINSHYWDGGLAGERLGRELGVKHFHTPHSLGFAKQRMMSPRGATPPHLTVVAGDSGNDTDMLTLPGIHAVVVGNALPELREAITGAFAAPDHADGVICGCRRAFGLDF